MMCLRIALPFILAVGGLFPAAFAFGQEAMFPFPVKPFSIEPDATDMSWMNEIPAGKHGFIHAEDGVFVDGSGKRVRFLGVNLCNSGAFPEHETSDKLAPRLAKLGINCVRLHHMDGVYSPRGVWDPAYKDKQHMDREQLDRLDYLIHRLKIHGIYVNINLHVSRKFTEADGFPDAGDLPTHDKAVDNFEPRMISLQKKYARDLLMRRNPYTGTRYINEPAVAFIETNNENSLLDYCADGRISSLPAHYLEILRGQWIEWLRVRYGSVENLRESWRAASEPLGENILANGDFSDGTEGWTLEAPPPAEASMRAVDEDRRCLHAKLTQKGRQSWDFQVHQTGLDLQDGRLYTLRFSARTGKPREIYVSVRLDKDPWRVVGVSRRIRLIPEWQDFEYSFYASQTEKNHTRVSFNLQSEIGEVWLANVELRPGGHGGVSAEADFDDLILPLDACTAAQRADFLNFAVETERRYARDMRAYIRNTLGAKSLVTHTQISYGGMAGVYRESQMDYGDMHGYWQHPSFPNTPWHPVDWRIGNTPMVKSPERSPLTSIALHRIAGKPFVVSEYNHPAPSDYSAECVPMLAAFAALQDWDGIFFFDYHSGGDWNRDYLSSFFQIDTHPAKIMFLPAAAAMFRRGDIKPASQQIELSFPISETVPELIRSGTDASAAWRSSDISRLDTLISATSIRPVENGKPAVRRLGQESPAAVTWDASESILTVNSPASRGVIGFPQKPIVLGGLTIELLNDRFAAITITSLDGKDLEESGRLLVNAVGRVENQGMAWNNERTSVGNQWGSGPVMVEGVQAKLSLQTSSRKAQAFALDGGGGRMSSVPCDLSSHGIILNLGPQWQTLGYEVVLER